MIIKFFGTRGSIPVCRPEFQEFGGNTTCVQIKVKETNNVGIIDAGTGIRELGREYLSSGYKQEEIFIAFTHFHWDHIQGFPFFAPAFIKEQKINILALGWGQKMKSLEDIFKTQMQKEYFPVQLEKMGADFNFMLESETKKILEPDEQDPKPVKIRTNKHKHPGGAYGYRIERNGKIFVFCTDVEHGDSIDEKVVQLADGADLLVHDAQYTSEELKEKKGWGHSSYEQAIEVAEKAGVKLLAITHHDPDHDDEFLKRKEKDCQSKFKNCIFAREKMEIEI